MNKDKKIFWIAGITILLLILLPYLGLEQFAITEVDLNLYRVTTIAQGNNFESFLNFSSTPTTISFTYLNDSYTYPNEKVLYLVDNDTIIYDSIPSLSEGMHTIIAYKFGSFVQADNSVMITVDKGSKTFYNTVETVFVPEEKIVYLNQTVYVNQTVNQTITVEKQVEAELTFLQKYGLAGVIFIVMGLIIIYLIYKRTR